MLHRNRKPIYLALAILLTCSAIAAGVSYASNAKKGAQTTVVIKRGESSDTDPAPISIEKIFVEGKEVHFNEIFLASPGWVKTLEVDLKNVSEQTLVEVAIQILMNGKSVNGEPGYLLDMFKGSPHYMSANIKAELKPNKELLVLKPGETTRLNWGEAYLKSIEGNAILQAEADKSYDVRLFTYLAINADTKTGWLEGEKVFEYSPGKWYQEKADWSDPKLQKSLDPNYIPEPEKDSLRLDSESNQYVLDSAPPSATCIVQDTYTTEHDCYLGTPPPVACSSGVGCVRQHKGFTDCSPGSPTCKVYENVWRQCSKYTVDGWVLCSNCSALDQKILATCPIV